MNLEQDLRALLEPLVREVVREEVKRAKLELRWVPAVRAAELLGITPVAVRHRVRSGQLPGKNIEGRVFVDMLEFDRQVTVS